MCVLMGSGNLTGAGLKPHCVRSIGGEEYGVSITAFQSLVTLFLCPNTFSMGAIIDHQMHHANDTHVAHHLFSRIPHYNMQVL